MLAIAEPADLDDGPRSKSGTARMCALTRRVRPVEELIRFVVGPGDEVVPDIRRRLPGRGLWLSLSRATVAEAARRGVFARGFRRNVKAAETLPDEVERLLRRGLADALAIAAKAGETVAGFGKVEDALRARQAVALLHAAEAAPDGVRKLDALARRYGAGADDPVVVDVLTTAELDLALGRANVVHAALLAGRASETFLARWLELERFRMAEGGNGRTGEAEGSPATTIETLGME